MPEDAGPVQSSQLDANHDAAIDQFSSGGDTTGNGSPRTSVREGPGPGGLWEGLVARSRQLVGS